MLHFRQQYLSYKAFTRFSYIYHKFLKYFTHNSAAFSFCIFNFLLCSFSLKVYANGSQPGSWTDCLSVVSGGKGRERNWRLPEGNERHLQGAVALSGAKKMQCQQQQYDEEGDEQQQQKSVKIMQFMRFTWQGRNASWQAQGHTGLTKKHTWRQLLLLLLLPAVCCVPLPPSQVVACLIFGNINLLTTYAT